MKFFGPHRPERVLLRRNTPVYAVVVQDLATRWIQSHPCRNQTSQETERSLRKFLEPSEKPKVIYIDLFICETDITSDDQTDESLITDTKADGQESGVTIQERNAHRS